MSTDIQTPIDASPFNYPETYVEAQTDCVQTEATNFEINLPSKELNSKHNKKITNGVVKSLKNVSRKNSAFSKHKKNRKPVHSQSTQTDDFNGEEAYKNQVISDANTMSEMEKEIKKVITMIEDHTGQS